MQVGYNGSGAFPAGQQAAISRRSALSLSGEWSSPFKVPGSFVAARAPGDAAQSTVRMRARGVTDFPLGNQAVGVGDSGVTVKVSDFSMSLNETTAVIGGVKYINPLFTPMGKATVTGTAGNDIISVRQDMRGNTILSVERRGRHYSTDLGRIAALNLDLGAGDDEVEIDVSDYYGGIEISGGAGDDEMSVSVHRALSRGVTVYGDSGDDEITVSGRALAVLIEGGAGDDILDMRGAGTEMELARQLEGGAGSDIIYGGGGRDVLSGGAGSDLMVGGAGDDSVTGGEGDDVIHGGEGDDLIEAGAGNDIVKGGAGTDRIEGSAGNDVLMGGAGGDMLSGGAGDDALYGGSSGDDNLVKSDTGKIWQSGYYNSMEGGAGADTFAPSSVSPDDIVGYTGAGSYLLDYDEAVDVLV